MPAAERSRRFGGARWVLPLALTVLVAAAACSTGSRAAPSTPTGPGDASSSGSPSVSPTAARSADPGEASRTDDEPAAEVTAARVLVLYYGDVGYFTGIIRIGRFEDSIAGIGDQPDGLTVTLERA
jgi:hypothetical protein